MATVKTLRELLGFLDSSHDNDEVLFEQVGRPAYAIDKTEIRNGLFFLISGAEETAKCRFCNEEIKFSRSSIDDFWYHVTTGLMDCKTLATP